MMNRQFVQSNITLISIILFITIFAFTQYVKPSVFYTPNGGMRQFGIGYRNKTIMPMWLFAIVLGIVCYVGVLYALQN